MKVLKDNYTGCATKEEKKIIKPYPRKHKCDNCGSELEYEESDLYMGQYGCMHLDCPCCGEDNMLDDNENNIILTKDNIEFPTHFHHVCVENGAVECCNEYFKEYINKAIDFFRANKDETDYGGHITGNFYFHVHRLSGDKVYDVTVSRDFYSMEIPFEGADLNEKDRK